jgi:hypothetical protein
MRIRGRPKGWSHILTSGDNPRIGPLQEGWYCPAHGDEIDRRVKGAHQLPPDRRRRPARP